MTLSVVRAYQTGGDVIFIDVARKSAVQRVFQDSKLDFRKIGLLVGLRNFCDQVLGISSRLRSVRLFFDCKFF